MVDFLLGRCDHQQDQQARQRLLAEPQLRALHDDVKNTFKALDLAPEPQTPPDIVERTLNRVRQDHHIRLLIANQEARRRPIFAPTFSLREAGAVVAAIALIAIVLVPAMRQGRQTALTSECSAQVGRIGTGLQAYAGEHDGQLPVADSRLRPWLGGQSRQAVSNSAALFRMIAANHVSASDFQCPAIGGGAFAVKAGMVDFPAPRFVHYSYQHTIGTMLDRQMLAPHADRMVILADASPVFEGGQFRPERIHAAASENHERSGQNVLYVDGHVKWSNRPDVGVGEDNIFLAANVMDYTGTEKPDSPTDTFLLPAYSISATATTLP